LARAAAPCQSAALLSLDEEVMALLRDGKLSEGMRARCWGYPILHGARRWRKAP
jgi:hypothetical protein